MMSKKILLLALLALVIAGLVLLTQKLVRHAEMGVAPMNEALQLLKPELIEPNSERGQKVMERPQAVISPRDGGAPAWSDWVEGDEVLGCAGYVMDGDTLTGYLEVLGLDGIQFLAENTLAIGENDWMLRNEPVYVRHPCWLVRDRLDELHNRRELYVGD